MSTCRSSWARQQDDRPNYVKAANDKLYALSGRSRYQAHLHRLAVESDPGALCSRSLSCFWAAALVL